MAADTRISNRSLYAEGLPFFGTTRVANKGVDVTLIVRPSHTAEAVKAARRCGVCGISTAVLEVTQTDPPDQRTLEHFCTLTGRLVFEDQQLLEVHSIPADTKILVAEDCTAEAFSKAVSAIKKKKGKAEPESDETGIIW